MLFRSSRASRRYATGLHPAGPTTPFGRAGPRRTIPALRLPAHAVPASRSHASRRYATGLHPAGPTTPFGRAGPRRTIPVARLPAHAVPASRSHASRRFATGLKDLENRPGSLPELRYIGRSAPGQLSVKVRSWVACGRRLRGQLRSPSPPDNAAHPDRPGRSQRLSLIAGS